MSERTWKWGRIQLDLDFTMFGVGLGFCFSNGSAFFCVPFFLVTRGPVEEKPVEEDECSPEKN
jgi:hypothetical protein